MTTYEQRQAHWERLRQEALEKSQQLAEQREQARSARLDELTKLYGSSESAYAKRVTYSSLSREAKEQIRAEAIETLKTTDMTQAEVAKQFGVSQNAINTWARAAGIPKHGSRAWNEARRKRHSEKLKAAAKGCDEVSLQKSKPRYRQQLRTAPTPLWSHQANQGPQRTQ